MKLYLSKNLIWTGTQADAKEAQGGTGYETIEVPTPKPELIAWLNEKWREFHDAANHTVAALPLTEEDEEEEEEELPPPVITPKAAPVNATLIEQIDTLEGPALFNAVEAVLGRMHEIGGQEGWPAFAKHGNAFGRGCCCLLDWHHTALDCAEDSS
jgi:hypothetical protein